MCSFTNSVTVAFLSTSALLQELIGVQKVDGPERADDKNSPGFSLCSINAAKRRENTLFSDVLNHFERQNVYDPCVIPLMA